jgi:hemerythrin-like metal-binding protein/PAS domain S-box-containing protein
MVPFAPALPFFHARSPGTPNLPGPVQEGLASLLFLLATLLLAALAWREPGGTGRWALGVAAAAAFLLALSSALAWLGMPFPALGILAAGGGVAASLGCLAQLPRWLASDADSDPRALKQAKDWALARDLEAQVEARTAELRASEARLEGFIQHAPAAIAFKDSNGHLMMVNRRAEALIGRSLAAIPDRSLESLFPPEKIARIREQDQRVLAGREELQFEESVTLPDGRTRDLLIQKFPLVDTAGRDWGLGAIATDITERKQMERVQLQHQKLESLGLLAGGIAHDFNNLLAAMLGNLEAAQADLGPRGQSSGELQALGELISRAAALVDQILAFTGKGGRQIIAMDLNQEAEGTTRLLRSSLSMRASIRWEPAPGLPSLEGDPRQIQSVVMNLVLNASEAVEPPGGIITIRTRCETFDQAAIDRDFLGQDLRPGPYLVLEVDDNGSGMPPEIRERIFEPFFTTKFTGRGLGLATVQGILRGHRGGVQVLSEMGKGTTFRLLFPAALAPPRIEPPRRQHPPASSFHSTGTVLVVDDEPALRQVASGALRRMGFDPLEARDGKEALQVYEANRERIILVLMDLTMPNMDGEETYWRLRRAGAMVPIVLSSGFSPEEALHRFRNRGLAGFLPKPYRFQTLESKVREALEQGRKYTEEQVPAGWVTWLPEFMTGHPLLDLQHQKLIQAHNRMVRAATAEGGEASASKALDQLVDLVRSHFATEERLMAETAYPNLREHQGVHAHLLQQAQDLARKIQKGEASFTPAVLYFLEDWTTCHLRMEDAELARHWQERRT